MCRIYKEYTECAEYIKNIQNQNMDAFSVNVPVLGY